MPVASLIIHITLTHKYNPVTVQHIVPNELILDKALF
jgi:hypothetical protein